MTSAGTLEPSNPSSASSQVPSDGSTLSPETEFSKLATRMKQCRACKLGRGIHAVFGRFDRPKWILVGQAPGKKEMELAKPFAGPAGKRLFSWLSQAGFEEEFLRSFCYLTAVMKCYPGSGTRGDLRPSSKQLENCAPFLEQELEIVRPEVVIPVHTEKPEEFKEFCEKVLVVEKRKEYGV